MIKMYILIVVLISITKKIDNVKTIPTYIKTFLSSKYSSKNGSNTLNTIITTYISNEITYSWLNSVVQKQS